VTLPERLDAILASLPSGWSSVRLVVTVPREGADRAALVLAPLTPGRSGGTFRITLAGSGGEGASLEAVRRVFERLDREVDDARLALPGTAAFEVAAPPAETPRQGLAQNFDSLVEHLPPDWSDLYLELELASSADIDRGALLLGPVNPFLHEGVRPAFRFRSARRFGYGAAPEMTRRSLERLDEAGISATLRLLRAQSEVAPVLTQGPVWREGGRAV
jgi:hypothetical protein